jgi:serine/threonine protein kinase
MPTFGILFSPKYRQIFGIFTYRAAFQYYLGVNIYVDPIIFPRYMESGSLEKMVQKYGAFPEEIVGVYISQVLAGLSYLHGQDIVHHNIKG